MTNPVAIDLIKKFEGYRGAAYFATEHERKIKLLTLGYGCTRWHGYRVQPGQTCTPKEAEDALIEEVSEIENTLLNALKVKVSQNQLAAMISLIYNIGWPLFERSTLFRYVNNGEFEKASQQFAVWNKQKSGGQFVVLPGLVKRREAERLVFVT